MSTRPRRDRIPCPWSSPTTPVSVTGSSGCSEANDRRWLSTASTRSPARSSSQWAARPSLNRRYAHRRTAPDAPCSGADVPNTGVRCACSTDRSRGRSSGCCSGTSQWAPVAAGS
ncbi:Uncharacterised protein [Mycobacteroides abscessus]|nr:Uncharacterised protein [Mycobacteroides abscessus]